MFLSVAKMRPAFPDPLFLPENGVIVYTWASLVAQTVKNLLATQETQL